MIPLAPAQVDRIVNAGTGRNRPASSWRATGSWLTAARAVSGRIRASQSSGIRASPSLGCFASWTLTLRRPPASALGRLRCAAIGGFDARQAQNG
jgi:hypothetical protein